jgi:ABC-type uncharacterized transport system substrate-binding protein
VVESERVWDYLNGHEKKSTFPPAGAAANEVEFVINLKAAKQIGLTLSPEFLSRANKVIK